MPGILVAIDQNGAHPFMTSEPVYVSSAPAAPAVLFFSDRYLANGRAPRPCGATRPAVQDPRWECTGRGLIAVTAVTIDGEVLPVVLPARAEIDPQPWWDIQPFTGGDHLHYLPPPLPERRPRRAAR